jgi:hypothetical protein
LRPPGPLRRGSPTEAVTGAAVVPGPKRREPLRARDRVGDKLPITVRDDRAARCWLDPSEEIHGTGSSWCSARSLPAGSIAQRSRSRAIACGTKGVVPSFSARSPQHSWSSSDATIKKRWSPRKGWVEWKKDLPTNAAGAIPRARWFLVVESTSDVEQPSPFAGRRSVGALRSVRILERALQPCIRDPIDDMRCSEGERGRAHIDVALRRPRRSVTCARPFGPCGVLAVLRKKDGPGLRAGRHHAARSFALQVFERGSATRGNAEWKPTPAGEDAPLRERARASLFESLLQKS